ncbi:MAG: Uma2 family endonuclease [Planctomycetales bacterium]|nr:Uma2 family endonuclease [Planctomycetales bacterium]
MSIATHYFSNDEYHRRFTEQDKVELIDGLIYDKMVIGPKHRSTVNKLIKIFVLAGYDVSSQGPVSWSGNEPEPDLTILAAGTDPTDRHPRPDECLLVIEVSDTSLSKDREIKLPAYQKAGIRTWIVNLQEDVFEIDGMKTDVAEFNEVTIRMEDII